MSQKNTPIQQALSFSPSSVPQKEEDKKHLDKALANPLSATAQVKSLESRLSLTYADIKDTINNNLAFKENQAVNKMLVGWGIFLGHSDSVDGPWHSAPRMTKSRNKSIKLVSN